MNVPPDVDALKVAAQCAGKIPYANRCAAQKALRHIEKSHRVKDRGRGKAMPYRCRYCHHWHLGSASCR